MNQRSLLLLISTLLSFMAFAQDKPDIKFNHVDPKDFDISKLKVDTSYGAVIIADVGSSSFEGNNKGWFSLIFKHQRRIRIINKKGFDLASVAIPLYTATTGDAEEKLDDLKASTYNLENGTVVETRLSKDAIFKDKQDKNHVVKKFTMPAVKEGSIIEYSYTINSDFLQNLQPWNFQGAYPRVWSEYVLDLPSFFEYVFFAQGYNAFDIKTSKVKTQNYTVREQGNTADSRSESYALSSNNTLNRWVIKNVPVLKEEGFLSSLENHISKIEFQMSGQQFPQMPHVDVMGTWSKVVERLLADEDFGERLNRDNPFLNDDLKVLRAGTPTKLEEAKKIYAYLKSNYKIKGPRGIYLSAPLKETFRTKSGYVADANILLATMLRHENIDASPVLLSTRANGYTNGFYPLISQYNYVICKVNIDDKSYFLDASKPYLGFDKLPEFCYNGAGRVINETFMPAYFFADSIKEKKLTSVMLFNEDKKPGSWSGVFTTGLGYYESCNLREKFINNGKEAFEKKLKESYSSDFSIKEIKYDDENNYEEPMKMSYVLSLNGNDNSNVIYVNPMIKEGYGENPFKSADRKYPVEMPYLVDETYIFKMEIPEGYVVDEIPRSAKVTLNEGDGIYEYMISQSDTEVNLRSHIKLEKATFSPEDYESLRNFFDYIVKKDAEQIVFKKK